jgi:tetratricopeptide (TPR) repeat protein
VAEDGIDDEPVAVVLWRVLVDLHLWASAKPDDRAKLFGRPSGAAHERLGYAVHRVPEIASALGTFGTLRDAPRIVSVGAVAKACAEVHRWAAEAGLVQTALRFAEAAAFVDPDNPNLNNRAGRAARRSAQPHRAEIWYDRAHRLAGRLKNRRESITSLIGRGALLRELGRYNEARPLFEKAARLASSTRRNRQAAEVMHEMFAVAAESGTFEEAERHARDALEHYPIHHPAVPGLVHDWGFLLVRNALYEQALPLLEALLPHLRRPEWQTVAWGTLGRAAAGADRRDRFEEAKRRVLSLIGSNEEFAAAALAHLAEGARFFGEWESGAAMAVRAMEIAAARQEGDVERGAHEILEALRSRTAPVPQATPPAGGHVQEIARLMAIRLRDRTRPARRPVKVDPEAGGAAPRPGGDAER